jgi:hypothetical protein
MSCSDYGMHTSLKNVKWNIKIKLMFLHKKCVFPTCSLVIYITFGQKILQNVKFTVNLINFNIFMTTLNTSSRLNCTKINWLFYYFKVIIDFKCNWVHRLIKWPCIALKNSSQLKANSITWEKKPMESD